MRNHTLPESLQPRDQRPAEHAAPTTRLAFRGGKRPWAMGHRNHGR